MSISTAAIHSSRPSLHRWMTVCAIGFWAAVLPAQAASLGYSWGKNLTVAQPNSGQVQGETALATDSQGQVWLSFIEADYHQARPGQWIAWPRNLRLFVSRDGGLTFQPREDVSTLSGDEWLAAGAQGAVYASFVQYENGRQRINMRRLDSGTRLVDCLPWDPSVRHDQSNVHVGASGNVYLVGEDITPPPAPRRPSLLYARSLDGGRTCSDAQRLDSVGQLPQLVETSSGVIIVGPMGYWLSGDGVHFPQRIARRFGNKLARAAVSPDHSTVYVVGDSVGGGLMLHASSDGGRTWRRARIDDAAHATEWRYPAVCVDRRGRVHVVWMDDRLTTGAVFHAYSSDGGQSFSTNSRVSDTDFPFPHKAPPPPPATQDGTWVGDYMSVTAAGDKVIAAWGDLRLGVARSMVQAAIGVSN